MNTAVLIPRGMAASVYQYSAVRGLQTEGEWTRCGCGYGTVISDVYRATQEAADDARNRKSWTHAMPPGALYVVHVSLSCEEIKVGQLYVVVVF